MENTKLFFDSPVFVSTFKCFGPKLFQNPLIHLLLLYLNFLLCSSISALLEFQRKAPISPKRLRWWTGSQTCPVLQWHEVRQEITSVFSRAQPDFFPSPVSDVPQTALVSQSPQLSKTPPKLLHFQIMVTCPTAWFFQSAPQELDCPLVESSWTPEVPSFITTFNNSFRVVRSFMREFCLTWVPVTIPGIYGKSKDFIFLMFSPAIFWNTRLTFSPAPSTPENAESAFRWSLLPKKSTIIVSWISSYVLVLNKG